MTCPVCGSRATGKVSTTGHYCWDCCVEFSLTRRGLEVYWLDPEGGLQPLQEEDRIQKCSQDP